MPSSIREQILARFATVAMTLPGFGSGNVFRARETAITRAVSPAIAVLYGGGSTVQRRAVGIDEHRITVNAAIFVRGDPWDQLADAIDVPLHAALMADAPLAALAQLFREPDQVEAQEADRTSGVLTIPYTAVFLTRAGDITIAP